MFTEFKNILKIHESVCFYINHINQLYTIRYKCANAQIYIYIYIYERETSVSMCYTITVKQKTQRLFDEFSYSFNT